MPEEQGRHGRRESDTPASNEDGAATELTPSPAGESAPTTPAPAPSSLRPQQRHIVWRWHVRRRRRKK